MTDAHRLPPFPPRVRSGHRVFHAGELEAQGLFGVADEAQATSEIVLDRLGIGALRLMESLPCFFLAAASPDGALVAADVVPQLRDDQGALLPLLRMVDAKSILFALPLQSSADAVIASAPMWGAGLVFVDFLGRGARYRINGRARILPPAAPYSEWWPVPCRLVHMAVDQAYPNCTQRVVRMEAWPG